MGGKKIKIWVQAICLQILCSVPWISSPPTAVTWIPREGLSIRRDYRKETTRHTIGWAGKLHTHGSTGMSERRRDHCKGTRPSSGSTWEHPETMETSRFKGKGLRHRTLPAKSVRHKSQVLLVCMCNTWVYHLHTPWKKKKEYGRCGPSPIWERN